MFVLDKICGLLLRILGEMAAETTSRVNSIVCRGSKLHWTVLHLRLVDTSHRHFRILTCIIVEWDWFTSHRRLSIQTFVIDWGCEWSIIRHRYKKCLVTLASFHLALRGTSRGQSNLTCGSFRCDRRKKLMACACL